MNLTIDAGRLAAALALVGGAVRAATPVLSNVRLRAAGGTLTLDATDLEVAASATATDLAIDSDGECLMSAVRLGAILKEAAGDVRVEADGGVRLTTAGAVYELAAEDVGTWPGADAPAGDPTLTADAAAVGAALHRVVFAAAKDEGTYATRSVLWDVTGMGLALVATDGKRLAVADVGPGASGASPAASCLVPPKAMTILARLCGGAGELRVWLPKAGLAHFAAGHGSVSTRLVEGRFPPYRDVIPKPKAVRARVRLDADTFHAAVRRAALMAGDESKRINFAFGPGKVTLEAQGAATGRAKVELAIEGFKGPAVAISFDPAYLIDYLRLVQGPLALELVDAEKSAVFRHEGGLYLVVPLV